MHDVLPICRCKIGYSLARHHASNSLVVAPSSSQVMYKTILHTHLPTDIRYIVQISEFAVAGSINLVCSQLSVRACHPKASSQHSL